MQKFLLIITATLVFLGTGCQQLSLNLQPGKVVEGQGEAYPVLVATTRKATSNPQVRYTGQRTAKLSYDSYQVWVPTNRTAGALTNQTPSVDDSQEFSIIDAKKIAPRAFQAAINQQLRSSPNKDSIFVFVHGYNVN